jgi:hypothetical protein
MWWWTAMIVAVTLSVIVWSAIRPGSTILDRPVA